MEAEVLIVEGWAGAKAGESAAREFLGGNYRLAVSAGPLADETWSGKPFSYAEMTARVLQRSGVPRDRIVAAVAPQTRRQRTYASAVVVRDALADRGIRGGKVNVVTVGAHAARSRLVYQKVLGAEFEVGVIAWQKSEEIGTPWWSSSERTKDFLTESFGYVYELLLNSGRGSNVASSDE